MDRAYLKWYFGDRWKLVREVEVEEWRRATPEERLNALDKLYDFARELDPNPHKPRGADIEAVQEVWRKLWEQHDRVRGIKAAEPGDPLGR